MGIILEGGLRPKVGVKKCNENITPLALTVMVSYVTLRVIGVRGENNKMFIKSNHEVKKGSRRESEPSLH